MHACRPELTAGVSSDTGVLVAAVDVLLRDVLASVCISVLLCLWVLRTLDVAAAQTFCGLDTGWACFLQLTVATKCTLHVDLSNVLMYQRCNVARLRRERERDYNALASQQV